MENNTHLVVGLGEIGFPIYQILRERYGDLVFGYDPKISTHTPKPIPPLKSLHICIPWGNNFIGIVTAYQRQYQPEVTVVHSTVPIGTTKQIYNAVHSPVLGRHPSLYNDIKKFTKWIGGSLSGKAGTIFRDCNLETREVMDSDLTEFLKLACLAKYGMSIAFADYLNKVCTANGFDYENVMRWDMDYNSSVSPTLQRPILSPPQGSRIGGHCVIPGTRILNEQFPNELLIEILKYQ